MTGAIAALAFALAVVACSTSGIPSAELPEAPIAVVVRSPEDSRRHAELLRNQRADSQPQTEPVFDPAQQGIARAKDIASYLRSAMTGVAEGEASTGRFAGRLAFLQPRSARIDGVASAWGEAVPHAWSADRTRLLFSALVDEFAQIFELEVASGEVRPITHGPAAHPAACYGPDGSYVLMTARIQNDEIHSQLELLEPGGANPRALTAGPRDYAPTCAADGKTVAWVTAPSRRVEWVMSLRVRTREDTKEEGGEAEPRRLGPGRDARFCGVGDWIVYSAPIQRGSKLWRVRADGTGRSPIGRGVLDETAPACSPDGATLVYVVVEDFVETLYVRRFDGSGDRILYAESDASHPVW